MNSNNVNNFVNNANNFKSNNNNNYKIFIRQRLAQILKKYPRLRILWSDSVMRTCEYFKILKYNQNEP